MSKKPDTASALAGILSARRSPVPQDSEPAAAALEADPLPSPAPPAPPPIAEPKAPPAPHRLLTGKSSDKANYRQVSVYLRKDTRKKVGQALYDADSEQDFSELVQSLLEQWLTSRT